MNTIVYREAPTLARDLGVPLGTLYALSNHLSAHYHGVDIPKRDGGTRRLAVPDEALKRVQRRIAQRLLAYRPVSPHATAYRPGASAVKNAALHAGKGAVLKLDIAHFFDSVAYAQVKERAFPAKIFSEPLRVLLSLLCYHGDALPQGAPSSPAIANLILRDFDDEVGARCAERGIAYSRYCDDLTFSGDGLEGLGDFVQARLRREGFFLQARKTVLAPRGRRQVVTGLVVNRRVNVPAQYRRRLRQELYYCRRFGVAEHLARAGVEEAPGDWLRRLLGRVGFWRQADPVSREAAEYQALILERLRLLSL